MAGSSVSPVVDSGAAAPTETGRYAILEQLLADDIHYIFGNPGTVEQGFLDALGSYPDLQYILTLQETIAVAIADGYARARHRPAVVQLHSGVGPRQRGRDALPGEARRLAAGRDRGRVGRPLRRAGRPDGRRPGLDRQARDEVGDAGGRSRFGAAGPPPGDQDRRHGADRARLRRPAGRRPRRHQRGADRRVVDAGDPDRPGRAADRPGRDAPGGRRADRSSSWATGSRCRAPRRS